MVNRIPRVVAAFSVLVLAGCGPTTADPDPDPSATATAAASATPIEVPDGTPEIAGFTPVFAVQYSEEEGPGADIGGQAAGDIGMAGRTPSAEPTPSVETTPSTEPTVDAEAGRVDGVVRSDDYLLVYSNDEGDMAHQVTAYDLTNGEREWSRVDPNWLDCHMGDPAICIGTEYSNGAWQNVSASVFDSSTGDLRSIEVGDEGTFAFVGASEGISYFLTWDGTHAVHMTGFDPSGAPVIDKNLRTDVPEPRNVEAIDVWIGKGRVLISIPGAEPGIYVASANAYANYSLSEPCISASDGIACADAANPDVLRAIDSVGRERWQVGLGGASLLDSAEFSGSLDDLQGQMGAVEDDSSSSEKYLVVTGSDVTTAQKDGSKLNLGERGTVDTGSADVTGIDLSHDATLLSVAEPVEGIGEASPPQIVSSILVGTDGEVASKLPHSRAKTLADQGLLGGEVVQAHTLAWSDDELIYTDQTTGIVAVYRAG